MRRWYLALLLLFGRIRSGVSKTASCNITRGPDISIKQNLLLAYGTDGYIAYSAAWSGTLQDCCQECCANTSRCVAGAFYPTQTVCELDAVVYNKYIVSFSITAFGGCGLDGATCEVRKVEAVYINNTLSFSTKGSTGGVTSPNWTGTLQDCCNECCSRSDCIAGTFSPSRQNCDLSDYIPRIVFDTADTIVLSNEVCASPPPSVSALAPPMSPPIDLPPIAPAPLPDTSSDFSSPLGIILGSVLGTLAVVLLCCLIAFFVLRKRQPHSTRKPSPDLPVSKTTQGQPVSTVAVPHAALPPAPVLQAGIVAGIAEPGNRGAFESHSNGAAHGLNDSSLLPNAPGLERNLGIMDWSIASASEARKPLGWTQSTSISSSLFIQSHVQFGSNDTFASGAAPLDGGPVAFLSAQLDAMHKQGVLLRGRYRLGDHSDRRFGGQGVVQFATHAMQTKKEYAVKFYLNADAFAAEKAIMINPALEDVMPLVDEVESNDYDPICVLGRPLPPFVVIERGESLDSWTKRAQADFASAMHILLHVVECAAAMHAAGIVHRDLKPPNIIFYPARNKWNIIDWGAAAQAGSIAPGACTLAYAPPEVVLALMRGETS